MNNVPQELESFVERLPLGVVVLDPLGRIRLCNDLAAQLLDISVDSMIAGNVLDSVNDASLKEAVDAIRSGHTQQQRVLLQKSGRNLSCTVQMIGDHELLFIVEDVTKTMEVEQLKRQFVDILLHKIRTPLATLKTSFSMLNGGAPGRISGEIREIFDMSSHEIDRLSILINDIRDLFMIETGLAEKDLEIEEFAVAEAFNRAIAELAKTAPPVAEGDAGGRFVLSGNSTTIIAADFEKTKKVFLVLLKNAVHYSSFNVPVEISWTEADGCVNVEVKDRGIGISPEMMPQLFGKFFREDNPVTRSCDGNGLGLFIAKSFVELMHGSIYCESRQKKGTSFFLTFPSTRNR